MTHHSFWYYWAAFLGLILSRYFVVAGGAYLLFYTSLASSKFASKFAGRQLRSKPPKADSIRQDIRLAVLSTLIFATAAAFVVWSYDRGATRLYADLRQYGYGYAAASFGLVLVLQDTYFYFMHRAFHQPFLFQHFHFGHHRSGEPTPWTSFAFDPAEAFLQAAFLVGLTFLVPLNFTILVALLLTMTVWTVVTHLGFELPAAYSQHWLSGWLIGSRHHAIHHRKYRLHYGLYFTIWDKLLGTDDPAYELELGSGAAGAAANGNSAAIPHGSAVKPDDRAFCRDQSADRLAALDG